MFVAVLEPTLSHSHQLARRATPAPQFDHMVLQKRAGAMKRLSAMSLESQKDHEQEFKHFHKYALAVPKPPQTGDSSMDNRLPPPHCDQYRQPLAQSQR